MTRVIVVTAVAAALAVLLAAAVADQAAPQPAAPQAGAAVAPWCPLYGSQALTEQEREYLRQRAELRAQLRDARRALRDLRIGGQEQQHIQQQEVARLLSELKRVDEQNPQAAAKFAPRAHAGMGVGALGRPGIGLKQGRAAGAPYGREALRGAMQRPGALKAGPRGMRSGPGLGQGPCGAGLAHRLARPEGRGGGRNAT